MPAPCELERYLSTASQEGRSHEGLTIRFASWADLQDWKKGDELNLTSHCQGFESAGVRMLPEKLLWDAFRDAMPVDERSIGAKLKIVVVRDYDRPSEEEVVNRKRKQNFGHTQGEWNQIKMLQVAEIQAAAQGKLDAKKLKKEEKAAAKKLREEEKAAQPKKSKKEKAATARVGCYSKRREDKDLAGLLRLAPMADNPFLLNPFG